MKHTDSEYMRKLLNQVSDTEQNKDLLESSNKSKWTVCYSFDDPLGNNATTTCNVGIYAADPFNAKMVAYKDANKKGRQNVRINNVKRLYNNEIRESAIEESYHLDISKEGKPKNHYLLIKEIENAIGHRKSAAGFSFGNWFITWSFPSKDDAHNAEQIIKSKFPHFRTCVSNIAF